MRVCCGRLAIDRDGCESNTPAQSSSSTPLFLEAEDPGRVGEFAGLHTRRSAGGESNLGRARRNDSTARSAGTGGSKPTPVADGLRTALKGPGSPGRDSRPHFADLLARLE